MRPALLAILTLTAFAALPGAAHASSITAYHFVPTPCTDGDECRYYMPPPPYSNYTLIGAPGEANRMTVTGTTAVNGLLRFRDEGAPIGSIPPECNRVDANEVTCFGNVGYADGGDGNDVVTSGGGSVRALGGPGDDELIGSDLGDSLDGGLGNDALRGNGGFDYLEDGTPEASGDADVFMGGAGGARVSYTSSTAPVKVDLAAMADPVQGVAGEGDRISDVNEVEGGMSNDDLRATEVGSKLMGGPGDDTLIGRMGNDELDGGYGKNVIDAGAGRDTIGSGFGLPTQDRVACGADPDVVRAVSEKDLIGGDCEQLNFTSIASVTSFLPLTALTGPVARTVGFSCFDAGRPRLELRVARRYRTRGQPRAGTLLGRRVATRRACRKGQTLSVRLSSSGQRLLSRHARLPVEVRVIYPGHRETYTTELVAP